MLEAGLIIIGLGIIGASYVISEKVENKIQSKMTDEATLVKDIWTEKDEKRVRERIDSIVEERVELAIDKTEDELSRISNEKIMSSNEFSEQLLGKIEHNHEEVVFLYNMLNEKEKQMKNLIKEIDTLKTAVEEKAEEALVKGEEKENSQLKAFSEGMENREQGKEEIEPKTLEVQPEQVENSLPNKMSQLQIKSEEIKEEQQEMADAQETKGNRNDEILSLYREGKSVLEISKALDMGQGEVKLIIDLFRGAK